MFKWFRRRSKPAAQPTPIVQVEVGTMTLDQMKARVDALRGRIIPSYEHHLQEAVAKNSPDADAYAKKLYRFVAQLDQMEAALRKAVGA
jgi:UDP-glucose 6-dehydrogenase